MGAGKGRQERGGSKFILGAQDASSWNRGLAYRSKVEGRALNVVTER